MMRAFLDTNILLDACSNDRPEHASAFALLAARADGLIAISVLSSSLKDVYYVYCRHYGSEARAREIVRGFCDMSEIVDLTGAIVRGAVDGSEPDFEDGLVREAALAAGADVLVTRDAAGFKGMPIPVLDADSVLELLHS